MGLPKAIGWCERTISVNSPQGSKPGYGAKIFNFMLAKYPKIRPRHKNDKTDEDLSSSQELENAATLLYDANRTTQAFFSPISESALQV